jgi:glucose dehydrogenase
MLWYFQCSPHDTHDWDAAEVPVLIDGTINGQPRKLLAQANRNGIFFVLDRTNGKNIVSTPFIKSANWFKGFDDRGQPIPNPDKEALKGGTLVSPNNAGAANWAPPTFDPETGLFYLNTDEGYEIHYRYDTGAPGDAGFGHASHAVGGIGNSLLAIDYHTGQVKWEHKYAGSEWTPTGPHRLGGLLSTAGHLLFAGDPGGFIVVYNPDTGRQIWHATLTAEVSNTPITYMLDGRQYFLVAAGDTLYSFTLQQ